MGWSIKTNNKNKWSIFSSVTDDIIITFKMEEELIRYIAIRQIYDGKLKAIEILWAYPDRWFVNDERLFNKDGSKKYYDWYLSLLSKDITDEEYYKAIDNKLEELMS